MISKMYSIAQWFWHEISGAVYAFCNTPIAQLAEQTIQLRQLTPESVVLRLALAMLFGGLIGLEREKKRRPAGFRTYMLVCLGAVLTMILGQYYAQQTAGVWAQQAATVGVRTDVTRFGAQVINGVGFLGAGTILVTEKQQIKGLTTAAGLWASACMGLALGSGFYECVFLGFVLILFVVWLLPRIESYLIEKSRNMNLYVELRSLDEISEVLNCLKNLQLHIFDMELEKGKKSQNQNPNAVFSLRLRPKQSHTQVVAALSQLETIRAVKEI